MSKVGFIGLGIMGKPMARNLLGAGIPLMVNDVNGNAMAELAGEDATAATAEEIAQQCEVIFTILPNGQIVQQVLFAVAGAFRQGALVVDMSSVTPAQSAACADRLRQYGVGFLDAPVSGGESKAIDGTLAFMCGGSAVDFERAKPYFEIMGASSLLIGGVGSGSVTKLANQVIVNLTIAAVSEALVLTTKAGADPEKVYQAIRGGLAGSVVLDAKAPMMFERNFQPGGKISINHKDIGNVMTTAHEVDVALPLTAQLYEIMQSLKISGHMDDDHAGIVQYFEKLADVTVKKHSCKP